MEYPSWDYFRSCGIVREDGTSNNANTPTSITVNTNPGHNTSLATYHSGSVTSPSTPTDVPQKRLKTRIPGTHWRSAIKLFDIAERFHVVGLRELARHHLKGAIEKHVGHETYVSLLEEAWGLEGEGGNELHECVSKAICSNMPLLLEEQGFQQMIDRTPYIACGVFEDMQKEIDSLRQARRR